MRVPRPGALSTSKWPLSASTRAASPRRPEPRAGSAPPTPSSVTLTVAAPFERLMLTVALDALRILAHVRDRLGDDVVRRRFDVGREPPLGQLRDVDSDRRPRQQGIERWA